MKFKLSNNPIDLLSPTPLEDYLRSLGISKVSSFIDKPEAEDEESYKYISNMTPGIKMLKKHIDRGSTIFLQVDSDTDGYTSAAQIYDFIYYLDPEADVVIDIHPEKEHGIVPERVGFEVDLVIVPDAGSNQVEEMEEVSRRADIIIIDHHLSSVDLTNDKIIVINNQLSPFFENKSLSGAGMVYKFIQSYCETYDIGDRYKYYRDLAAIGIVADSMDSRNLDNNFLIYQGLNNIENRMIKAMLKVREYSVSSVEYPNKIDIAFYVAPIINGLIRFGTMEEKENMFLALADNYIEENITTTYRGVDRVESYYDYTARVSSNIKAQQDSSIKKVVPVLEDRIESEGLHLNQIIICKTSKSNPDEVPKSVTGLVASKLSTKYKKPVLVLRPVFLKEKVVFAGSGRGFPVEGFATFKDYLNSTGIMNYAEGHHFAFGASVDEDRIQELTDLANFQLEDVDFGNEEIEVHAHLTNSIPMDLMYKFANSSHLYGNSIPEPKFLIDTLVSKTDVAKMGSDLKTMKINIGGLSCIMFRAGDILEEIDECSSTFKIRVMGKPSINEYRGSKTVQIKIDYIEILDKEVMLF